MRHSVIFTCLLWVGICLMVSGLTGWVSSSHINGWYQMLTQPPFSPPRWIFAPVWTVLYIIIGIVGGLLWISRKNYPALFIFYMLQLILNFSWSFIFFVGKNIGGALVDILALWISVVLVILLGIAHKNRVPWLLLPYLLWVSFAAILNYFIWQLN